MQSGAARNNNKITSNEFYNEDLYDYKDYFMGTRDDDDEGDLGEISFIEDDNKINEKRTNEGR